MSEPPDNPEEGAKISEPPRDSQDTQPLNPMRAKHETWRDRSGPLPPATVLREATSGLEATQLSPPTSGQEDTDRVRLIPKIPAPPPWRVIFQVTGSTATTIGLDVRRALVIGRYDPDADQQPDLDLSPHRALEHGVSRQHAVLLPTNEALYLIDRESTNGTWINGLYLEPGERYPLTSGDQIEFGLLSLVVRTVIPLNRSRDA